MSEPSPEPLPSPTLAADSFSGQPPSASAGEASALDSPSPEEMMAAIMAMPTHQKRLAKGDGDKYAAWLRRGDAGNTPAAKQIMPTPPLASGPHSIQVPSIAESDEEGG